MDVDPRGFAIWAVELIMYKEKTYKTKHKSISAF